MSLREKNHETYINGRGIVLGEGEAVVAVLSAVLDVGLAVFPEVGEVLALVVSHMSSLLHWLPGTVNYNATCTCTTAHLLKYLYHLV